MDVEAYPDLLREKYRNAMKGFAPTGREPEAKERLRYLLLNQRNFVSSMSPEPGDWNDWTEKCIRTGDWAGLCRVVNQRIKSAMLPVVYGGFNHERNVHCMLECLVCGNLRAMENILPMELRQVKKSYHPVFVPAAHLLMGLWYRDGELLEQAVSEAENFLAKKCTMLDRGIVSFLLDLSRGDPDRCSEDLLAVCRGQIMDKKYILGMRPFGTYAHGLYVLAGLLWPEEDFRRLEMPRYKNFLPEFARWRRDNPEPDLSLWFRYPEDLELLNEIYAAPPPRLVLWARTPPGRKQEEWYAHGTQWVNGYVEDLWEMGVGREST